MKTSYEETEPARAEIDQTEGPLVIEFGTPWCGHCRAALPLIETALGSHPKVRHMKIEDGSGRLLGRSFDIRLWPTLVFLRDGKEVSRMVRPHNMMQLRKELEGIDPLPADQTAQ